MSDRVCVRCTKKVWHVLSTAHAHRCEHGFLCDERIYDKCVLCWEASEERKAARKAALVSQVQASLPIGRKALLAERGGIRSGPVGVVRRGGS